MTYIQLGAGLLLGATAFVVFSIAWRLQEGELNILLRVPLYFLCAVYAVFSILLLTDLYCG